MILESILGVVTGFGGSIVTAITNYKMQKMQNEYNLAKIEAESKAMIAETNARIQITKTETDGKIQLARTELEGKLDLMEEESYQTTVKQDANLFSSEYMAKLYTVEGKLRYLAIPFGILISFLFGIIDIIKAIIRPGLTLYLTLITSWLTYKAWIVLETVKDPITATMAVKIFNDITQIVTYLTVSAVLWYFGDRRMAKFLTSLKKK